MINNLLSKIMGSHLTKNYEVDKEPYMHGGLHNLWKVYRGKKKDRNNMDVSLFIFEKKSLDKKKLSQVQKDDIFGILKKDPQNLAKLKHPSLLSLIEQPMEDKQFLIFVTEPVEFNLSSLQFDATKRELIPGDLEIKCFALELMDGLNFLHNNAKMIHMGLAPEHIYITKEGKLKLGGLNFAQQFSTAESLNVPLNYDLKINEYAVVPNLRFAAPELTDQQQCSVYSDFFSVGTLLYFMEALNKNKSPFLLNQADITDKAGHQYESGTLQKNLAKYMIGFEDDFEVLIRQLTSVNIQNRGSSMQIIQNSWFSDPLLKAIKYLEILDSKDHLNKVQFLQGITRILEKFDKKALLKKVVPLMLDQMKVIQLSVNVLPNILEIMERQNFLTTTEFRDNIWPQIQKLCKAKELPAQSLFIILKNTELFMKFVGPTEFQSNFLILINKSLECGVPKLQFLALTKVPMIIKQIEYNTVKQSILPRILMILEKPSQVQLKQKTLEIMYEIISIIDSQTMKDKILKTFEKVRAVETDPQICMLLLKTYEKMAKVLGVEEIGLKILPGIIPMLISGTFTRSQFKEMMSSVRRLLDQIEQHREKDLREMGQDNIPVDPAFDMDGLEKSLNLPKSMPEAQVTNKDVFDFLSSLERGPSEQKPMNMGNVASSYNQGGQTSDILSQMASLNVSKPIQNDTFANNVQPQQFQQSSFGNFGQQQQPQQQKQPQNSGWDSDPVINFGGAQKAPEVDDFFVQIANKNQPPVNNFSNNNMSGIALNQGSRMSQPSNQMNLGGGLNQGFGAANKIGNLSNFNDDPFGELIGAGSDSNKSLSTGLNLGFNNQAPSQVNSGFGNFGNQSSNQSYQQNPISFNQPPQQQQNMQFNQQQQQFGNPPSQSFGQNQSQFGTQQNNFQQQPFNQSNQSNLNNSMGMGFLNNQQQQLPQNNSYGSQNMMNQNTGAGLGFNNNINSGFGGVQSNQSMAFGGSNTFGQFPAPKQNQQISNNPFDNEDFFSQFSNTNSQQKSNQNNLGDLF